ncbi:DUF2961 domain-containing protein [Nonomuraea sp. K274]|uniref:DUF2961 domain-containing protein n=1 Tax=Nonomuraea cypriaca TaxID=1187855 RepID=A0A931A4I2_9ACTN|nr:glycoside hydrolase family 172 protein [Nonomuraea cypriaca]MBF8186131.1 DUF2961 domain-containing protein [Nonomuraea cypriaca]
MSAYGDFGSSLRDLPRLREGRRHRESSWDRTGGNDDRKKLEPGESHVLADIDGAGSITHIWMTVTSDAQRTPVRMAEPDYLRRLVLRIWWDGEEEPSVLVPLGDFFGVGHGRTVNFASAPLQMSPEDGRSLNSFFHMPFSSGARIEVASELEHDTIRLYYYVDYERFDELEPTLGRFHASWNRQSPTDGIDETGLSNQEFQMGGVNLTGDGNYSILEAEGRGHFVGCVLNVRNLRDTRQWNWYGEGDDMIFIDGEPFPPRLHGTGTEDYFNLAWCPTQQYSSPYHGLTLPGGENWGGEISLYRFHIEDPIAFERSIRVTIEHGHANRRSDDLSSVAYWYQTLPHLPLSLPPAAARIAAP